MNKQNEEEEEEEKEELKPLLPSISRASLFQAVMPDVKSKCHMCLRKPPNALIPDCGQLLCEGCLGDSIFIDSK